MTTGVAAGSVLDARGITVVFGGVCALDRVDFQVAPGECVGLIGPNGSGKTTLLSVVTGTLRPNAGRVRVCGVDVTGRGPRASAQAGVIRVFQTVEVFPRLTVLDNLMVARAHARDSLASLLRPRVAWPAWCLERAGALLELVGLQEHALRPAGALSFGQQRLLELAMGMMSDPRLLLLDEPTAGVNPGMRARIVAALGRLHAAGTALVVVEHEVSVVFALCSRVVVLDAGRVLAVGAPAEIQANEAVARAYLGQAAVP